MLVNASQQYQHYQTKQQIVASPQQLRSVKPPPQPSQTGARKAIENYSFGLNDCIGKGFSSKVYRGRNDLTGEQLAVKVIEMSLLKTPLHHALLLSEMESLKSLDSDNVIKLHKILQTQNNTYIITEFCDGGDLGTDLTPENHLQETAVADIMIGVIQGYKALKSRGIIHRDLKPANILMKGGVPKIADFGFATTPRTRTTMPNVNVGSPLYMSPQALRQNQYSEKSDIWALGVSVFEMMYGQVPWQAGSEKELAQKMLTTPCHFPSVVGVSISEECKSFIRYCLIVDEEGSRVVTIEDLERHPWLKRRWVQSRAQESAKKALRAPIVQVKQMSHCKPIRNSPLGAKNTNADVQTNMFEVVLIEQDGKENSPMKMDARKKPYKNQNEVRVDNKREAEQQMPLYSNSFVNQCSSTTGAPFMALKQRYQKNNKFSQDFNNSSNPQIEVVEDVQKSFIAEYMTDLNTNQMRKSENTKVQHVQTSQTSFKQNDFIILAQINFCRYLFKLSQMVDLEKSFHHQSHQKEKLIFLIYKHLLQKMRRLKSILQEGAQTDPFNLIDLKTYQQQNSFKQLSQAIVQYDQKYTSQFNKCQLTLFQSQEVRDNLLQSLGPDTFCNDFSGALEIDQILPQCLRSCINDLTSSLNSSVTTRDDSSKLIPLEQESSLVLLDYLVTYLQLVTLFRWDDWNGFAQQSRIEQIAQGKPVRLTYAHFTEIKRKIQETI